MAAWLVTSLCCECCRPQHGALVKAKVSVFGMDGRMCAAAHPSSMMTPVQCQAQGRAVSSSTGCGGWKVARRW